MRYVNLLIAAASCILADQDPFYKPFKPENESLPYDGFTRDLMLNYKPLLEVVQGCNPDVAVNAAGETNSGLEPANYDRLDVCTDPTHAGQLYSRSSAYNDKIAVMYAWYFPMAWNPKSASGSKFSVRYDWQQIVVWLSHVGTGSTANDYSAIAISYSGRWGYTKLNDPIYLPNTTRPLVRYELNDDGSHGVVRTYVPGLDLNLVAWDRFTNKAKEAINDHWKWMTKTFDFKGTLAPFSDKRFSSHLDAAWNGQ